MSNFNIQGLHHVTATVNDAQEDYDFYTKILGLRLVKKTVNFDNHKVYHFYYGNEAGEPGTIFTTFPYKGHQVRTGEKGTGQVAITNFSAPAASFGFWKERLVQHGIQVKDYSFFGFPALHFEDPSGLELQLLFQDGDHREPWQYGPISAEHMIRGLHSVVLSLVDPEVDTTLLTENFGFSNTERQDNYLRFESFLGGAGNTLFLRDDRHLARGKNGIGTVHHVAWRIENRTKLEDIREYLINQLKLKPTEVKDRKYFQSVYFRIPGGVLFELATMQPGFTADEDLDNLGEALKLPDWEEINRQEIEDALPKLI
jgi:glyoxalase family protein